MLKEHSHLFRAIPMILIFILSIIGGQTMLHEAFADELLKKTFAASTAISLGVLMDWYMHRGKDRIHNLDKDDKKWGWARRIGYIFCSALVFSAAL